MDIPRAALHLVPDASFAVQGDKITQWRGSAPQPSPAQLSAAWAIIQQQDAAAATVAQTAATNEATIRQALSDALAINNTFLAIANPTAAQVSAQVKVLTRNQNRLIRMAVRRLESAT